MAQNECQQMAKGDFYADLRNHISNIYDVMQEVERYAEFLNTMDATTLDNMGVPDNTTGENIRTNLSKLRVAMNEIVTYYEGGTLARTEVLKDMINEFRHI